MSYFFPFAFSLFVLLQTWLGPLQGLLIDRLGTRVVVSFRGDLLGLGWAGSGYANSLPWLYFWYGSAVSAPDRSTASIGTALKWFPDRRGLAAGLTAGAYGFGTALTILPIQWMIESSGYRSTFIVWGVIQGVLVLAAAQFLRKPSADLRVAAGAAKPSKPSKVLQNALNYTPGQKTWGSWETVFWVAVFCDLLAAGLAFFWLRPLAQRLALGREQAIFPSKLPGRPPRPESKPFP